MCPRRFVNRRDLVEEWLRDVVRSGRIGAWDVLVLSRARTTAVLFTSDTARARSALKRGKECQARVHHEYPLEASTCPSSYARWKSISRTVW